MHYKSSYKEILLIFLSYINSPWCLFICPSRSCITAVWLFYISCREKAITEYKNSQHSTGKYCIVAIFRGFITEIYCKGWGLFHVDPFFTDRIWPEIVGPMKIKYLYYIVVCFMNSVNYKLNVWTFDPVRKKPIFIVFNCAWYNWKWQKLIFHRF